MVELGHTSLDQGDERSRVFAPGNALVDLNVAPFSVRLCLFSVRLCLAVGQLCLAVERLIWPGTRHGHCHVGIGPLPYISIPGAPTVPKPSLSISHPSCHLAYAICHIVHPSHAILTIHAAAAWIHNSAFGKHKSDEQANIHVLPPNTDISELSSLDLKVNMNELNQLFQQDVHEFFHFTPASEVGSTNGNASFVTQNEMKSMRQLGNFATRLLQNIYACTFDIPVNNVSVELPQPSGMFIQSADDVKKLQESGTLLPGDTLKLRKNLMRHV